MVHLNAEQLRQLQMIELEMLLEVDRICRKCDIQYNIIGGTLLGAIRHGGFIPWDDDADVTMMRSDYLRFADACRTELDSTRFYFQDAWNTEGYRWSYGKIRRKDTLFLREYQEHMPYEQGVFIDVFPVDGIPDNYFMRVINNAHCFCIRKILWSDVGKMADKSAIKRIFFCVLSKISREKILKHYEKLIEKRNRKRTKFVRIALMPLPNRENWGYRREWYEKSRTYMFEECALQGIANAEEFLTYEFGDYMKIPPEDKRKVHPVSDILLIINDLYREKEIK